jgi:hypothetical protein
VKEIGFQQWRWFFWFGQFGLWPMVGGLEVWGMLG